ncbi:hypothetical protein ABZ690_34310 [Streptomyces sp. NPDC006967]|uniref:hypothetical protein n=1 Tax=Streptomyces sp. NPDC006967 TaxID=3156906 RepID=UPI00340E996B
MSTTSNRPADHPDHQTGPVIPGPARRSWRYRLAARLAPSLAAADTVIAEVISDLRTAEERARRWQQHAESFAQDAADRASERDGTYRERAQLLAWLTALHPASAVITPAHDGEGTEILYLVAGGWQLSWHISAQDADLFRHVTVVDVTDRRAQWDGHGTAEKYQRIRQHVRLLALEGDVDRMLLDATAARASLPEADPPCARCKGSAIDPEDSFPGDIFSDFPEPPALEPCRACQFPAVSEADRA